MKCTKCHAYSYPLRRCTIGMVNPRTKKATKEAMKLMGPSYICMYNKWKEVVMDDLSRRTNQGSEEVLQG